MESHSLVARSMVAYLESCFLLVLYRSLLAKIIPGLPDDVARECLYRIPFQSLSNASSSCESWRNELESTAYFRQRAIGGQAQHIFIMTQLQMSPVDGIRTELTFKLKVYDFKPGEWSELPPVLGMRIGCPIYCRVAVVGQNVVVLGGLNPEMFTVSNEIFIYNLVSAKWRRGGPLPDNRTFFGCTSDSHRMVYILGGHDVNKNALKSGWAYDVVADEWYKLPDMAVERDECIAAYSSGKVYVAGGYMTDWQGVFNHEIEVFDAGAWTWVSSYGCVLGNRVEMKSIVGGQDGKLYMLRSDGIVSADSALERGRWEKIAGMPDGNSPHHLIPLKSNLAVICSADVGQGFVLQMLNLVTLEWTNVEMFTNNEGFIHFCCSVEI